MFQLDRGVFSASGQELVLDCQGAASAVVSVVGEFEGEIVCLGKAGPNAAEGGRLLFQSGVGSLGTNVISADGAISKEYRLVAGGGFLVLRAQNWVSGSAVVMVATTDPASIVFVNGPVHSALDEATRAGRAYSVGSGVQSVSTSNYLQVRFANPIGSGKRCYVVNRNFSNNRASGSVNLEAGLFPVNPATISGTAVTPNNLLPGGDASASTFEWLVDTNSLGTPAVARILPVDGVQDNIEILRLVNPGQSFAYQIQGAGVALASQARISFGMVWYEEDFNG